MTSQLRVLQLEVTPVFVSDDGEHLTVVHGQPIRVPAADVAGFSEKWPEHLAAYQAQHEAQYAPQVDPPDA